VEHHDGFAMFDSGVSDWTAVKMRPKRDLIGDLSKAIRAAGLHFAVSSDRVELPLGWGALSYPILTIRNMLL